MKSPDTARGSGKGTKLLACYVAVTKLEPGVIAHAPMSVLQAVSSGYDGAARQRVNVKQRTIKVDSRGDMRRYRARKKPGEPQRTSAGQRRYWRGRGGEAKVE